MHGHVATLLVLTSTSRSTALLVWCHSAQKRTRCTQMKSPACASNAAKKHPVKIIKDDLHLHIVISPWLVWLASSGWRNARKHPSSRQVKSRGQKSVQMFPGNQISLGVEALIPSQLLWKVAHYICSDVSRQTAPLETDLLTNPMNRAAVVLLVPDRVKTTSVKQQRIKCEQSCCITSLRLELMRSPSGLVPK